MNSDRTLLQTPSIQSNGPPSNNVEQPVERTFRNAVVINTKNKMQLGIASAKHFSAVCSGEKPFFYLGRNDQESL